VPGQACRIAGVSMAGFRGQADNPVDLQVVPYPAFTIFIDLSDALLIDDARGERSRGSAVLGPVPGTIRVGCGGREVDCLQIRLSPVVSGAALGAGSELDGRVVALEDLWGREAMRIRDQLHGATSWEARFAIAGDALARRHNAARVVAPELAFIWRHMVKSLGQVRVERLATEVGWSRKRLWSRFRSQIGFTPKRAANLIRFDYAAHRLAAGHGAAAVAAESGYADQSHLHRDVSTMVGLTPTAVATAPWLAVDDVAWARHRDS
jgi:AraC-like DNA-binding protein